MSTKTTGLLRVILLGLGVMAASSSVVAQTFSDSFDTLDRKVWTQVDRGELSVRDGVLALKDCYVYAGDVAWKNYSLEFKARAPEDADTVRIFSGFRFNSDQTRYVFGLRGGNNNDLFLARYGDRNNHALLGISPLEFIPKKGVWYTIRIDVQGSDIQVFLNNETEARLTVKDPEAPFKAGKIALGGGWSKTEFDSVKITPLTEYAVQQKAGDNNAKALKDAAEKSALRKIQRAAYKPARIETFQDGRSIFSLNGDWLFLPDYEVGKNKPWEVKIDDNSWHVMDVPTFWTPMVSWNYGEGEGASEGRASKNLWEKEIARRAAYTFDAFNTKIGYYRHTIILPENLNGKTIQINFDAIGRESEVWVNGKVVAEHTGMFAPVRADITKHVHPGENIVVVRAGDSLKNKEYNTGDIGRAPIHMYFTESRGIWQNVSLEISDPITIDDTFFKPQLNHFDLDVTVKNRSASPIEYKLAAQIRDHASNRLVYDAQATRPRLTTDGGKTVSLTLNSDDKNRAPFKNWSPEIPNLYRADIFAFNYTQDPSVDLQSFGDKALVFQKLKEEVFSTDLPNGDYVITLQFGDATQPSLAEAYIGRDVNAIEQAIVRDFCAKGEFITVLQSLTVSNGKLEITLPQLPKPSTATVLNRLVIEKRSEVSPAKWNLGLNHFNVLDNVSYNAGFRTIGVDGDNIVLNGKPFKLRGATMTPNLVRANDKPLAEWFMKTIHENNISVAKNHGSPFNETWFNAADEAGVGLSQEGIWVWLMHTNKGIPNEAMLKIWKDEYSALLNKQKNHPSLLWLTHNSEMKLWLTDDPKRYEIHSDAVKEFRKVDPTRPVVADTGTARGYFKESKGYARDNIKDGKLPGMDDGDIDDTHTFHNWYDEKNFFWLRDGISYIRKRTPGRPFTSNEFATGYPDSDTGHALKHYIYEHMVTQAHVGKWCYEDRDPKYWLNWLALVNKESQETIRTTYRDTSAGMMIFAMATWFQNLYDVKTIKPADVSR